MINKLFIMVYNLFTKNKYKNFFLKKIIQINKIKNRYRV